jgi:hypothetical protein
MVRRGYAMPSLDRHAAVTRGVSHSADLLGLEAAQGLVPEHGRSLSLEAEQERNRYLPRHLQGGFPGAAEQ